MTKGRLLVALLVAQATGCNALTGASSVEIVPCIGNCGDASGDAFFTDARYDSATTVDSGSGSDTLAKLDAADAAFDGDGAVDADPTRPLHLGLGRSHSCVVLGNGDVRCWGANATGQLGDGTTTNGDKPGAIAITLATQIGGGDAHTCARVGTESIACWGSNGSSELATAPPETCGAIPCAKTPVTITPFPGRPKVLDLVLSSATAGTFALTSTGLLSWGNTACATTTVFTPKKCAPLGTDVPDKAVLGGTHACAVFATGPPVQCWGSNVHGQLGRADPTSNDRQGVAGLGVPKQIAAGREHTCVLDTAGVVYCWGANDRGQLGVVGGSSCGGTTCNPVPTKVPLAGGLKATAIALGRDTSCAIVEDAGKSAVQCWGANDQSQCAVASADPSPPTVVPALANATEVALGGSHGCAIVDSGLTVKCWGLNADGQVGIGRADAVVGTPAPVSLLP